MYTTRPNLHELAEAPLGQSVLTPIRNSPYWSPLLPSPQDYMRALFDLTNDYYGGNERLAELNPATAPTSGGQPTTARGGPPVNTQPSGPAPPGHLPMAAYQHHQHHHHHQQQQQQQHYHQQKNIQQNAQNQQQQRQQPPVITQQTSTGHTAPQGVSNQQQQQPPATPQPLTSSSQVTPGVPNDTNSMEYQEDQPQPQPQQQQQPCNTDTDTSFNESKPRVRLTDEERLRHKRERNRRAAANCRRRKDEKLKSLEDENAGLKRTIESLQARLVSLEAQLQKIKLENTN